MDCPHMMFVLQFSNLVCQVVLPLREQDQELNGKAYTMMRFPHAWSSDAYVAKYGRGYLQAEDLSSIEKIAKGAKRRITMGCDDIVEHEFVNPDEADPTR